MYALDEYRRTRPELVVAEDDLDKDLTAEAGQYRVGARRALIPAIGVRAGA